MFIGFLTSTFDFFFFFKFGPKFSYIVESLPGSKLHWLAISFSKKMTFVVLSFLILLGDYGC